MTGEAVFSDSEGRELARIDVERVESRDGALHVTGRMVLDGEIVVEGVVPLAPEWFAERAEQQLADAGGIESVLKAYEGIAVNGMTAAETMAALRELCQVAEVIDGEIVEPIGYGTSYHYPHCNIGACTGCIPQEVVDDHADFAPKFQRLLAEGYEDLVRDFEAHAPYPPTHPRSERGYRSPYTIIDEAHEWAGFEPVEDDDGAPSTYDLGRLSWMYRHRLTADTLRWSDIQIKGLGNGS